MDIGLEYFRWSCFQGGYEWQDEESLTNEQREQKPEHRDKRFLVERPSEERTLIYHPLVKFPTLFKEFAALTPNEESFAAFANKYGPLGFGHFLAPTNDPTKDRGFRSGEPWSGWLYAWARVQAVVTVLDAIQSRDLRALEQWLDVRENNAGFHWKSEYFETAAVLTYPDRDLRSWLWTFADAANDRTEQFVRLASGWVQDAINDSIATNTDKETAVSARVLFNEPRGAFLLHIVPRSLLAAIWLQCARVLTVNPTFKRCESCRTWFELSPATKRKQTKYCSDRCKMAAYRKRKGNSNIFAWMNASYRQVRSRHDWGTLSESERVTALKEKIKNRPNGQHEELLEEMDRVGRWPRAMVELEESWLAGQPNQE